MRLYASLNCYEVTNLRFLFSLSCGHPCLITITSEGIATLELTTKKKVRGTSLLIYQIRRFLYLTSLLIFTAASIGCALVINVYMLIAFRCIQSVGTSGTSQRLMHRTFCSLFLNVGSCFQLLCLSAQASVLALVQTQLAGLIIYTEKII